ncbi:9470_t:CDS:1, partial [Paraglomus brasilianum]
PKWSDFKEKLNQIKNSENPILTHEEFKRRFLEDEESSLSVSSEEASNQKLISSANDDANAKSSSS